MQPVHVGLVRKSLAVDEIAAAARNAAGDPVRFVSRFIHQFGADQRRGLGRQFLRNQNAPAERFGARIGEAEVRLHCWNAVPHREHTERIGEVFHRYLGAQFVEAELGGQACRQRPGTIDQQAAAMSRGNLGEQEVRHDLALRRQQRAESTQSRLQFAGVGGDQAIEEDAGVLAADLDDATVGKKRSFHLESLENR